MSNCTSSIQGYDAFGLKPYHFFKRLMVLPFVEAIYIYGSRARGDFDEWSDIDLAIDCPKASSSEWLTVKEIVASADTLLPVECVRLDEIRDEVFKRQVEQYKRPIYQKPPHG